MTNDKDALWKENIWYNAYISKNLFRFIVDGKNGFGEGDQQSLYFSPAGCSVKQGRLANLYYRYERYASLADEDAKREFQSEVDQAAAGSDPVPCDISLLTAAPQ